MFYRAGLISLFLFLFCALVVAAPLPSDGLEDFDDIYDRGLRLVPYEFDGDELLYVRETDFDDYAPFERDDIPGYPQENMERRGFFSGIGNAVKSVGKAVGKVASGAKNVVHKAASAVGGAVKRVASGAKNVVHKAASAVKNAGKRVTSAVKNTVHRVASTVKKGVSRVASGIRKGVNRVASGVKKGVKRVASGIRKGVSRVTSGIKKGVSRVASGIRKGVSRVASGVKNGVKRAASAVKKGVSAIKQGVNKYGSTIKQGLEWAKQYGPTIGKVGLKALATGGSLTSKFAKFIPGVGAPLSAGLKIGSKFADVASKAIPAKLPGALDKTMGVLNEIENPQLPGPLGAVVSFL